MPLKEEGILEASLVILRRHFDFGIIRYVKLRPANRGVHPFCKDELALLKKKDKPQN